MKNTAPPTPPPAGVDWLGFPCPWPTLVCRAGVPRAPAAATLGTLLDPNGAPAAREPTEIRIWYDDQALHVAARCPTAAMDRVRALAARTVPYARDAWGDDAIEVQIDVGRTGRQHRHFILPPNGIAVTFTGSNNCQLQGWHPPFSYRVGLAADAWSIEAAFPFAILGRTPAPGDTWGFNAMRVNRAEPHGYVQWAPTFGGALRTELFGTIQFDGPPGDRAAELDALARRAAQRTAFFLETINRVQTEHARQALGVRDWDAWGRRLAGRRGPVPLRWEDVAPGRVGIPAAEHRWLMEQADAQVDQVARWSDDPPDPAAFGIEPLEALGDAYLLTGNRRYVAAFERAIVIHARRVELIAATVTDPAQLHHSTNPYHDAQIIRVEMLAYAYLSMAGAGLGAAAHAAMMQTVLRGGRFAAFNISSGYTYGNHQVYESGGLAAVAALFPEFPESDQWAATAARAIRRHLEHEVYPDGGYAERCGYHSVAMSYAMHAVATIRANGAEHRFAELMNPPTLGILERMHEWVLHLAAPDGTLPAFGDYGAYPQLRFLRRGAALFSRPDFAWPLAALAPALVPPGLTPREPAPPLSRSLESHFTVLRDGWTPASFFMAVDHGPLGGQHSHVDTLGFVAHAHGRAVAIDTGIGTSYDDPRYRGWFRSLRAHNVIAIDDLETEKVAERTRWQPGALVDVLELRSHAYQHALGVRHDRAIYFVKRVGWLIHDRLAAPAALDLAAHQIDWMLHTPYDLAPERPGLLHAAADGGGLLVLAADPDTLEPPVLEKKPASAVPPESRSWRLWDTVRRLGGPTLTPAVTSLAWRRNPRARPPCEFAVLLLPYQGPRPAVSITRTPNGFTLQIGSQPPIELTANGG